MHGMGKVKLSKGYHNASNWFLMCKKVFKAMCDINVNILNIHSIN